MIKVLPMNAFTKRKLARKGEKLEFGSDSYRFTTLEPNNIMIEIDQMGPETWHDLSASLGMGNAKADTKKFDSRKFLQKIQTARKVSPNQVTELLDSMLSLKKYPKLTRAVNESFCRNAIPQEISEDKVEAGWSMQLPTPKPNITFGYRPDAFRPHLLELQRGIISKADGEPCFLSQISQPIPDIHWPFLSIEIHSEANELPLMAAKHACAGTGATCNNALMILQDAAKIPDDSGKKEVATTGSGQILAQSFSIAIVGRTACLNSHHSEGILPHSMTQIRSFQLDTEEDVQELCSCVERIMWWAEDSRLPAIALVLDRLDRRVHYGEPSKTPLQAGFEMEDWSDPDGFNRKTKIRRPSLREKLPSLTRLMRR